MKKIVLLMSIVCFGLTLNAKEYDIVTGLVIDEGIDDIKEHCNVCHPGRFIIVNGGGEKFWTYKIKVMQKGFGLWELDKETKKRIVHYLSKNYAKKKHVGVEE